MGACLGTLGHAATGPVAFGAPVRPYEAAKPKSADRPSRVSVCAPGTLISLRKGGGLWFFARYTKGYYGRIFLDRGPRQQRSTLDVAQAARTVRCASEASAGPRAKRPSCDGVVK